MILVNAENIGYPLAITGDDAISAGTDRTAIVSPAVCASDPKNRNFELFDYRGPLRVLFNLTVDLQYLQRRQSANAEVLEVTTLSVASAASPGPPSVSATLAQPTLASLVVALGLCVLVGFIAV